MWKLCSPGCGIKSRKSHGTISHKWLHVNTIGTFGHAVALRRIFISTSKGIHPAFGSEWNMFWWCMMIIVTDMQGWNSYIWLTQFWNLWQDIPVCQRLSYLLFRQRIIEVSASNECVLSWWMVFRMRSQKYLELIHQPYIQTQSTLNSLL